VLEIDPTDAPLVFVRNKDPPVRPPILLNPAPEMPTEPPLMPPARVAVPLMLSVPVVTAFVMDALPEKVVNPVLATLVSEPLLRKLVVPVPLKLVAVIVPLLALKVSVELFKSAPKLPPATVNNADPPVTFTAFPLLSVLLTVKSPSPTFNVPLKPVSVLLDASVNVPVEVKEPVPVNVPMKEPVLIPNEPAVKDPLFDT